MTPHDAFEEIEKRIPTGTPLTDALSDRVSGTARTSAKLDLRAGFDLVCRLCLTVCVSAILASCEEDERPPVNVRLLSTDVHIAIAQHNLVLPFVALEEYSKQRQSFSLDRAGDNELARRALNEMLRDSADPKKPLPFESISVQVSTYGWNDGDIGQRRVCRLLTREWARSVCDNPWAALQQALPINRFRLVNLGSLQIGDPQGLASCIDDGKSARHLPKKPGEAEIVCKAPVYGGKDDQFHRAVVRIDGELGALWMVSRDSQSGETVEAMTEREGKAIVAFVKYGLGSKENFQDLHDTMCRLRRPLSKDGPPGPDCPDAAPHTSTRTSN